VSYLENNPFVASRCFDVLYDDILFVQHD
jgi:hypothetical protein